MSNRGVYKIDSKTGKATKLDKEKAAPENLPPELRVQPSAVVTKDIHDPEKMVKGDERHVRNTIRKEYEQKQKGTYKDPTEPEAVAPEADRMVVRKTLTQNRVYGVMLRVMKQFVKHKRLARAGNPKYKHPEKLVGVRWLYFPKDSINEYHIRPGFFESGNPPADVDRPKHLRRLDLVIDLDELWKGNLPDKVVRMLRSDRRAAETARFVAAESIREYTGIDIDAYDPDDMLLETAQMKEVH